MLGPPPAQTDHDPFGGKGHTGHRSAIEAQHLVECSSDAHVILLQRWLFGHFQTYEDDACASLRQEASAKAGAIQMITGASFATACLKGPLRRPSAVPKDPRLLRQFTHRNPRSPKNPRENADLCGHHDEGVATTHTG